MVLRLVRAGTGLLLGASGALMYAASWQRWADVCSWGDSESGRCLPRQDHRYDFVVPSAPWEPVGDAAQLAGASLLVLALAFAVLPWALAGRRPGTVSAVALVAAVAALLDVGVATVRSGAAGTVVQPIWWLFSGFVWLLVPLALLVRFAIPAGWWGWVAGFSLLLSWPTVAGFTYAVGPYDAQPWYEAVSGAFTVTAGLCLLGAAVFSDRSWARRPASSGAAPAATGGAAS